MRHLIILLIFFSQHPHMTAGDKKISSNDFFLETRLSKNDVTEGDALIYEVTLYSPTPYVGTEEGGFIGRIDAVGCISDPDFKSLSATHTASDNKLVPVEKNGMEFYAVVIDRYFVTADGKGKFTVDGGKYRISYQSLIRENNPFTPDLTYVPRYKELSAPSVNLKVSSLPLKKQPVDYSGGIGDFEIYLSIPEGRIRAGSDAVLTVNVSGIGNLSQVDMSKISINLPTGMQFKSKTDSRQFYVQTGQLGSEMEIEVVFMPKISGEYVIDDVKLTVFNPSTGRYETAVVHPITITVDESIPSSSKNSTIYI